MRSRSRSGPSFFGLPSIDDPNFYRVLAERQIDQLRELRYIATEVGLHEAKRFSVEVRRWWISEMQKEAEQKAGNTEEIRSGRKTVDIK